MDKLASDKLSIHLTEQERESILSAVTNLLEEMTEKKGSKNKKSVFLAIEVPLISIAEYLARIVKYAKCETASLIGAVILIDRYLEITSTKLSNKNVHRYTLN